ncbi:MAG: oligopeptidase A, partial [Acidimicrobiia bacterium]|nr:oligopeptidase A [Acidimicrobiia bacterium]
SYTVSDSATGEPIATFHMDLHPRRGTFGHAAAFPLIRTRQLPDGSRQQPEAAIVANFTRPTTDKPSLLQHHEVETLFHEFGHILHQVLSRTELASFSGTEVERDFVEAPSQIMEHWTWEPEILEQFARHHESGEPIPTELIDSMVAVRRLNQAVATLRQVQFGKLDLELHRTAPGRDLDSIVAEVEKVSLFPHHEGTFFPASFGHLLGGYDAGYYGYLWSEVYGDDMFSRFSKEGVRSSEVGADYRREILESGGSRDALDHLRAFLGRDPENGAFLEKLGIPRP